MCRVEISREGCRIVVSVPRRLTPDELSRLALMAEQAQAAGRDVERAILATIREMTR